MLGSTLWLTLVTLLGLIAGFAREWLLIHAWGASNLSDGFLTALFLPEAFRMALAAGLISAAALPLYQQRGARQRTEWLNAMSVRVLLVGLLVSALLTVAAPLWVRVVGPGLNAQALAVANETLWVLAWCIPGFVLHGLLSVPLQANARFLLAGLGSLLFNLPAVAYLAVTGTSAEPQHVALACLLGSLLMPAVLFGPMWQQGWRPWRASGAAGCGHELLSNIGPLVLSNLASQGLALLERMVASMLGEGAVAWLNLARKLINLPLIVLLSLNQVLLGLMSRTAGEQRLQLLKRGIGLTTMLTLPAALGLIGATPALVQLMFPDHAAGPLSALLAWFAGPLLFGTWNSLLARYAYAAGDTRVPLICELKGVALNVLLLAVLPVFFGMSAIPIALTLGMTLTCLLLMRTQGVLSDLPWKLHCLMAVLVMLGGVFFLHTMSDLWQQLLISCIAGAAVFGFLTLWIKPWRRA